MEIVSEVQNYTANVTENLLRRFPHLEGVRETLRYESSRLCCWLHQKLGNNETPVNNQELLPLSQLVEVQLKLQLVTFLTENFVDIKTQLQLMHATLDDLQQKGERVDKNFKRLYELLKDISTCQCEPQDRCTCSTLTTTTPSLSRTSKSKNKSKSRRSGVRPRETLMLQVDRLDVPM
ncbi:unnamed protein product [Peronospora effusa]|uniref:Uncharacterized protein n=1 Tax=Peronospora effusa TaxID=542832 RepID=A0A3R7W600_9STRA|nr:hypothetical protein DD237_003899 [Peronospora effusa]CAI5705756.1 unnamed protein product [Peronospora effusa]